MATKRKEIDYDIIHKNRKCHILVRAISAFASPNYLGSGMALAGIENNTDDAKSFIKKHICKDIC